MKSGMVDLAADERCLRTILFDVVVVLADGSAVTEIDATGKQVDVLGGRVVVDRRRALQTIRAPRGKGEQHDQPAHQQADTLRHLHQRQNKTPSCRHLN